MAPKRIVFGGFLHETNTFGPSLATYKDFVGGGGYGRMSEGEDLREKVRGVNAAIGGAMEVGEQEGWECIPTLYCMASPSAHVTEDAFERITTRLLELIAQAGEIDGICLDLHGAMVTQHLDDGEGEILKRIRAQVGADLPITVSLDLHANVTPLMVEMADVLESYRTYPHVDMAETGRRSARMMARLLAGEKFAKAFRQIDFLTAISWQTTFENPAKALYEKLEDLTADPRCPSLSFNMGFPAADFPDCGMAITAYGPGADIAAEQLALAVEAAEADFAGPVWSPEEGVREAMRIAQTASKPVVISDTQDNPGAGGDSDTMGMLRALVSCGASGAIGNIFDPESAAACHAAGEGATIKLALGAKSKIPGDAPFEAEFLIEKLTDGRFLAKGGYYSGRMMDMGPSALLRIGEVKVALVSSKAQMADREMFRSLGVPPEEEKILVVKSSNHFRADFQPIAETILVCAAPGPMAVDPATLPWTRLRPGLRTSPLGTPFQP